MSNKITSGVSRRVQAGVDDMPIGYANLLGEIKSEITTTQLQVRQVINSERSITQSMAVKTYTMLPPEMRSPRRPNRISLGSHMRS